MLWNRDRKYTVYWKKYTYTIRIRIVFHILICNRIVYQFAKTFNQEAKNVKFSSIMSLRVILLSLSESLMIFLSLLWAWGHDYHWFSLNLKLNLSSIDREPRILSLILNFSTTLLDQIHLKWGEGNIFEKFKGMEWMRWKILSNSNFSIPYTKFLVYKVYRIVYIRYLETILGMSVIRNWDFEWYF